MKLFFCEFQIDLCIFGCLGNLFGEAKPRVE